MKSSPVTVVTVALASIAGIGALYTAWKAGRALKDVGEAAGDAIVRAKESVYGESSAEHLDQLGEWGAPQYGWIDYLPPPFGTGELLFDRWLIRRAEAAAQGNLTDDARAVQASLQAEFGDDWQERSRTDPVLQSLMRQHLVDLGLRDPGILTGG